MFKPKEIKEKYDIELRCFNRWHRGFSATEFLYNLDERRPLISDTLWSVDMALDILFGDQVNDIGSSIISWNSWYTKGLTLFYPEGRAVESCKLLEECGAPDFERHPSYRWNRMVDAAVAGTVHRNWEEAGGAFTCAKLPDDTPITVHKARSGYVTVYVRCSKDYLSEHIRIPDLVPVVEAMLHMLDRPNLPFDEKEDKCLTQKL